MALTTGIASDIPAVGPGERSKHMLIKTFTSFEDGLKVGRFAKFASDQLDNMDGSATPSIYGVVLRLVGNAIEDTNTYDAAIHKAVDCMRFGIVTVEAKSGETAPDPGARVYVSNDGDANDGMVTSTNTDVAVNAEFIEEVTTGVWKLLLTPPAGDVATHVGDATGAHAASAVSFVPAGTIAGTDVQTAVAEVATDAAVATAAVASDLADHEAETTGAHAASAISVTPAGNITETEGQAALEELDGLITTNADAIDELSPATVADPGDGNAIPVLATNGHCALTSAGAETRTLADPGSVGQTLSLFCDTYVGNIVVTAASAINLNGDTTITFGGAGEAIFLRAISISGSPKWTHDEGPSTPALA